MSPLARTVRRCIASVILGSLVVALAPYPRANSTPGQLRFKLLSQDHRKERAEHVATDRLIALVVDRSGLEP
jgi:hypothetical protein